MDARERKKYVRGEHSFATAPRRESCNLLFSGARIQSGHLYTFVVTAYVTDCAARPARAAMQVPACTSAICDAEAISERLFFLRLNLYAEEA